MDTRNITIAFVTDDGITISAHFGRAKYYEVVRVQEGVVTHREQREKQGHHTFAQAEHQHDHMGGQHGFDEASREKHATMVTPIMDCQIMVARGMGAGAYHHLTEAKIVPILTDKKTIEEAVTEIISGVIVNHTERLH
jgi:predicted Fe-Mo cluster-binding NifX family protein